MEDLPPTPISAGNSLCETHAENGEGKGKGKGEGKSNSTDGSLKYDTPMYPLHLPLEAMIRIIQSRAVVV